MKGQLSLPNFITALRIVGTLFLLFTNPFSVVFYVIYTFCGITDVLDGWIARKTKSTSEFGAKLDSIADLLFYFVMGIKIFPVLWEKLPTDVWCMVGVILLLRAASYLVAAVKYRRFASLHTYMNKLTGLVIFTIPYFIRESFAVTLCKVIAGIAGIGSIEELIMHISSKDYQPGIKTILNIRRNQKYVNIPDSE